MKLFDIIQVKSGLLADNASQEFCLKHGAFCKVEKPFIRVCIPLGNTLILEFSHCFSHVLVFCSYCEKENEKCFL